MCRGGWLDFFFKCLNVTVLKLMSLRRRKEKKKKRNNVCLCFSLRSFIQILLWEHPMIGSC